jgi:hypothetical protein
MAKTGQDFTTYAGDAALPIFTVYAADGVTPLNISSVQNILWNAARDLASAAVLSKSKTAGSIAFVTDGSNGQFQVTLAGSDTAPLTGYYIHSAMIIDSSGNQTTVSLGRMQVGQAPIWTYSGDPSNSDRDAVRLAISDTDESSPLLFDSEIDYTLTQFANPLLAAAQLARTLAGKFAQKVNKSVGDLRISYSDIAKNYRALADDLQEQGEATGVQIYAGGTSKADMRAVASNSDRPHDPFRRKQFNIPNAADTAQIPGEDCE